MWVVLEAILLACLNEGLVRVDPVTCFGSCRLILAVVFVSVSSS